MTLVLDPASIAAASFTTGYQLQIGPDGAARLILLGTAADPDVVLAVLGLDAAQADRLAQELTQRRHTYEQAHQGQGDARR